jgi:hypothetical protein
MFNFFIKVEKGHKTNGTLTRINTIYVLLLLFRP